MASIRRAGDPVHVRRLGAPPRPAALPRVLRPHHQEDQAVTEAPYDITDDPAGRGWYAMCRLCPDVAGPFQLLSEVHRYELAHQTGHRS